MSKWEMVRLGDITSTITKGTTPTTLGFDFQEQGINFVKIECITENGDFLIDKFEHISEICNNKLKRSQLEKNDILFSIAGAIGRTAIVTDDILPANTNQALAIIRLNDSRFSHNYVIYSLKSDLIYKQFEKQKQGVAQLNISLKNVSDLKIPLPPLEIQHQIVENLDKVTHLIDLCNQILKKFDSLVKSRFVEMFGDTESNSNGFPTYKLSSLCAVSSSKRIYQDEQSSSGVPFLRISNLVELIESGYFNSDLFIPEGKYHELLENDLVPKAGDILVTSRGTLGKCYIVQKNDKFYFQDGMISWLYDIDSSITPLYLTLLFDTRDIKRQIENLQSGSTVAYLSIAMLKKLNIVVPPITLQEQFAAFVEQTDKSKLAVKKVLEKAETLKKALMQEYFG